MQEKPFLCELVSLEITEEECENLCELQLQVQIHADILLEKPHKSIITPVLQTAGDSLGSPTIGSYITDFFLAGGS